MFLLNFKDTCKNLYTLNAYTAHYNKCMDKLHSVLHSLQNKDGSDQMQSKCMAIAPKILRFLELSDGAKWCCTTGYFHFFFCSLGSSEGFR